MAHSRATAFGMISPKTSMTRVNTIVTKSGAIGPTTRSKAQVAADAAMMWDTVTPIIAAESVRSGRRNASR